MESFRRNYPSHSFQIANAATLRPARKAHRPSWRVSETLHNERLLQALLLVHLGSNSRNQLMPPSRACRQRRSVLSEWEFHARPTRHLQAATQRRLDNDREFRWCASERIRGLHQSHLYFVYRARRSLCDDQSDFLRRELILVRGRPPLRKHSPTQAALIAVTGAVASD